MKKNEPISVDLEKLDIKLSDLATAIKTLDELEEIRLYIRLQGQD